MDVENIDGLSWDAASGPGGRHAHQTGDRRDEIRVFAGHPIRHESSIGMSDDKHLFSIQREASSDRLNQSPQVAGIVHTGVKPVAASLASIPELCSVLVFCPVREAVEKPFGLRQGA